MEHKTIKCLTFEQHTGTQISMRGKVFLHFLINSMMEFLAYYILVIGKKNKEKQQKNNNNNEDYSR